MIKYKSFSFEKYVEILLVLLFSGIGLYARFPDFPQPYLWLDEAWRGLAIISCDSPQAIIDYMSNNSEFILLSEWLTGKISLLLVSDKTLALRIIPLLFSILCSVGIFKLSKSLSKSYFSVLPLALINGGYLFILHAREFKPYIIDLFFVCFAYYLAILACESKNKSNSRLIFLFCVFLCLFALSSLSFLFIIPSLLAFLYYKKFPRKKVLLIAFSSVITFLLNFYLYLSPQSPEGTQDFWSSFYLDKNLSNLDFFVNTWIEFISQSSVFPWQLISLSFFILLPLISLIRKDGIFLLFLGPFLVQCCLSYFRVYPLFQRPSYYLYGLAIISLSYSVSYFFQALEYVQFLRKSKHQLSNKGSYSFFQLSFLILILFLLLNNGFIAQIQTAKMWPVDQGREIVKTLIEEYRESDSIVYNQASFFTLKYYASFLRSNSNLKETILNFSRDQSINDDSLGSLDQTLTQKIPDLDHQNSRLWISSTHVPNITQNYIQVLNNNGTVRVYVDSPYQRLLLFEF